MDEKIAKFFIEYLEEQKNNSIKALTIQSKIIPQRHLERIYSLTPVLEKFENRYWKSSNITLNKYEKRLKENAIKKYNQFFNIKIDENFSFIKMIKVDNKFPISCPYKNIHLLGDKITIILEDNEMSQNLGYFLLGVGLGELNSRGFGMLNYQYSK